jgi:hypothetical protein
MNRHVCIYIDEYMYIYTYGISTIRQGGEEYIYLYIYIFIYILTCMYVFIFVYVDTYMNLSLYLHNCIIFQGL